MPIYIIGFLKTDSGNTDTWVMPNMLECEKFKCAKIIQYSP